MYDSKRNKTGMKAGAIETLHRRLGETMSTYTATIASQHNISAYNKI